MRKLILLFMGGVILLTFLSCEDCDCPLDEQTDPEYHLLYSSASSTLDSSIVLIYSTKTGEAIDTLVYTHRFLDLEFTRDGSQMVIAGHNNYSDGLLWIEDYVTHDTLATFTTSSDLVSNIELNEDENHLLVRTNVWIKVLAFPSLTEIYSGSNNSSGCGFLPGSNLFYYVYGDSIFTVDYSTPSSPVTTSHYLSLKNINRQYDYTTSSVSFSDSLIFITGYRSSELGVFQVLHTTDFSLFYETTLIDRYYYKAPLCRPNRGDVFLLSARNFATLEEAEYNKLDVYNWRSNTIRTIIGFSDYILPGLFCPMAMDITPDGNHIFVMLGACLTERSVISYDLTKHDITNYFVPVQPLSTGDGTLIKINPFARGG